MESKVKLSRFSLILTILINTALIIGCIATFGDKGKFIILLIILLTLVTFGLLYAPLSITADEDAVTVRSAMRRIRIPIRDIESVEVFQPTLGAIRICASGGYMGYWGMFREGDIGNYVACYGKASDCFLIRMKNGDKYLLGCENPSSMVSYISSRL